MDKKQFRSAIFRAIDELHDLGYELPDSLKRRDKREPGRDLKESIEDRLMMTVRRYFKKQKKEIEDRLRQSYPERDGGVSPIAPPDKPVSVDDLIAGESDDEFMSGIIRLVGLATTGGVNLFKDAITIGMDYSLVNEQALDFARNYSYELINKNKGGIDATTRDRVSNAISRFIETPGYTLRDISRDLEPIFGLERARQIAITETTRAFAEGNKLAGEELAKEYPDVKVIKTWFTNNDDRLCDICLLNDGEDVELHEAFPSGDDAPPAHVGCRCWMTTSTKI